MNYSERAEVGEGYDSKPQAAPIGKQAQELGMQVDRIEKMIETISGRLEPILAPESARESQEAPHTRDAENVSELAHRLRQMNMHLSHATRLLEDLHSRIEL